MVQLEHPHAAGSGVLRAPLSPHHGSSPALMDAGLGILGWMLLGMQVAPATVAMENTLAVKFPATFMCPSLSLGESPCPVSQARPAPHCAGCAASAGTVCAGLGFSL